MNEVEFRVQPAAPMLKYTSPAAVVSERWTQAAINRSSAVIPAGIPFDALAEPVADARVVTATKEGTYASSNHATE